MPSRPTTPFNIKASYRFGYPPYTLVMNPPYDRQMERVYWAEGRCTKGQCERISLPSSSPDIALLCLLPSSADAMLSVNYNNGTTTTRSALAQAAPKTRECIMRACLQPRPRPQALRARPCHIRRPGPQVELDIGQKGGGPKDNGARISLSS